MNNKFCIQDSQYKFPYHYIPHFDKDGIPTLSRRLKWGFEYLCYQDFIRNKIIGLNPKSVLEVGCGDGYFIGSLPAEIETRIGVDISEKAILLAKALNPHCTFFAVDAKNINQKFDVVVAIEVLEHIPDENIVEFIDMLHSKVNPNGVIVISVPTTVIPLNKKHFRHYTLALLKKHLSGCKGLEVVSCNYVFSKPWWYDALVKLFENKLFCLEVKSFMKWAYVTILKRYQVANEKKGQHLVATLENMAHHR